MECEVIDLQKYRDDIERKEREQVETLAQEVREALKEMVDEDMDEFVWIHSQISDPDLLSPLSLYDYSSLGSMYDNLHGAPCPHCGKTPQGHEDKSD